MRGFWDRLRKHAVWRRCVAGLDVSTEGVQLVILTGDGHSPDAVCCAEQLVVPDAWVLHGEIRAPQALARWLKHHLQANDYVVDRWFIGLSDDQVRYHLTSLPAGLSPEDVLFQLQREIREVFADQVGEFALDYEVDIEPCSTRMASLRYLVGVCPQACVDVWLDMAHAGGWSLAAVEPRRDALARVSQTHLMRRMPAANVALALQYDAALGLALAGWAQVGCNFLPHRPLWLETLRRAWWTGMVVCVMGGVVLAAGFALVMTASAEVTQSRQPQWQSVEQTLIQARQSHQQAQVAQKMQAQRAQWLLTRQAIQAQSLAWSQVLSHASHGIWVSHIQQQGERWQVEGEALSSAHVQRLLSRLKALDIWGRSPELPHLQLGTSAVEGDLKPPVWLFRIEAELKAGG